MFDRNSPDVADKARATPRHPVRLLAGLALILVVVPALWTFGPDNTNKSTDESGAQLPLPPPAAMVGDKQFLDAADAFRVLATIDDSNQVRVRFSVAGGYYLYRRDITVQAINGWTVSRLIVPPGVVRTDAYFGRSAVLRNQFEVLGQLVVAPPTESASPQDGSAPVLTIGYRGCADDGICYPPITRQLRPTS